ncbi:helix-turn-helix domain-containing protein [Agreia pratensis]|uniref:Transcriptional regulator, XRE family with cupin sensor n=1 Tax=Agreia pratensis TaxID=150121 RepID=A0A1X7I1F2_9MICO|nr:helix-turn-helix domain-containing protein [Agreia pratensis]SMG08140.1 transcriptional regulator, XRE family with cupin sensor [Agreia pratensis]
MLESGDAAALSANESLGRRLRELRTQSGLSLRALARSLDISASAVSQIETGVMVPSVNRLIAIVTALGVPLSAAFEAPGAESAAASTAATLGDRLADLADEPVEGDGYVISRAGRVPQMNLESGVIYRRLSPGPVPGLEIFESTYPAGSTGSAHGDLIRHDGFEIGSITSGTLTITFEREDVTLSAGDSITFPATRPHRLSNRSGESCVAVWLIVHS